MKRLILMAAAVLMTLSVAAETTETFPSYIQVNGRAEKEVVPNEFYLMIEISERDSKGKISVESQQKDMLTALKRVGVDVKEQLTFANLASEFFKKKNSVATARYQLKLTSTEQLAKSWKALNQLGFSQVSLQRVAHSDLEAMKVEVRKEAMRNARQTAKELAEAVGQSIGKCFYVYDSNSNVIPRYYNNMKMVRAEVAYDSETSVDEDSQMEFKTIKLEYSVQAKFILE